MHAEQVGEQEQRQSGDRTGQPSGPQSQRVHGACLSKGRPSTIKDESPVKGVMPRVQPPQPPLVCIFILLMYLKREGMCAAKMKTFKRLL